jgi:hypothetical protein
LRGEEKEEKQQREEKQRRIEGEVEERWRRNIGEGRGEKY